MPSLRNPVGPLPASIYWRRRIVVLAALAVVVTLVCVLTLGGGGGTGGKAVAGSAGTPASSLTPGPTGRGGSNDGTGSSSPTAGAGASGGTGTPTTAPSGAPVVTGSGSGGSGAGGSAGTGGSGGSGSTLAPNQSGTANLPTCVASDLDLSLVSTHQTYGPSQFPAFQLGITNTGGSACKVDLGAKSAVLSITSDTGATVWSSGYCPKDPSQQWYAVPAVHDGTLTALFGWGRTTAKAGCAPGSGGGNAPAGTYVAHVAIGSSVQPQLSFKLAPFGS